MKALPPLVVPSDLDLGDITNVKAGDEVAIIHTHTGKREVRPGVVIIKGISKGSTGEMVAHGDKTVLFRPKFGGAAHYFMGRGVYFYSANPLHIAEAKERAEMERKERKQKEKEYARKMDLAKPIGDFLGDGEREDDMGRTWQSHEVAESLVVKLSDEQLKQLASWLGVSPAK